MTTREDIEWRRGKVEELRIKGYDQTRKAHELQVFNRAISTDVKKINTVPTDHGESLFLCLFEQMKIYPVLVLQLFFHVFYYSV